jgi:3',5'-cyclic AMP phosphodiesterase CpdA
MRIAHLTDLHFQSPPSLSELFHPKRWIGTSNLYLLGRHSTFSLSTQRAVISAACAQKPDLFLMTGDITAQALEAECALAKTELTPLLEQCPSFLIYGNHDIYTSNTPNRSLKNHLGTWLPPKNPYLFRHESIAVLYIETCRVDWLSRGWVDPKALEEAQRLLEQSDASFTILSIHYPILDRRGAPYGPAQRAIRNGSDFREWLKKAPIDMIIHGHEHHGYQVDVQTAKGSIPCVNPGSSGYAQDEQKDRRAHFTMYTIAENQLTDVARFAEQKEGFAPTSWGR